MGGGNPLKKVAKVVKTAANQTREELSRTGDTASKIGGAMSAAIQDPGTWTAYLGNPTLGIAVGSEQAVQNYQSLNQAEKDAAKAEAEQRMAKAQEEKAMREQEKMTSDRAKAAADQAKERAARLGKGRRGLLYQETGEQGVKKSTVLGG